MDGLKKLGSTHLIQDLCCALLYMYSIRQNVMSLPKDSPTLEPGQLKKPAHAFFQKYFYFKATL